ncbi:hypothetical protein SAICODRAFT_30475 [Saitoella complicata NRRL Y-17804]|uniref:uncharacterized protein n=1 Tax=Saitoella complicata (strain BCRC 22490 / CBS 7301 / JCM 7358 / NBRC 10748 / NRRL Y-17804) TaxID=698492 RepID=UPI000867ED2F|nr:uncharacterized protein SAICODRAFT_30475 [Saitoella complicata NRRL Y-17804]ODQ53074.1 hypothetical protein SAICODRAFT_30475 [Saitoella complicata NRRL Y-17804]
MFAKNRRVKFGRFLILRDKPEVRLTAPGQISCELGETHEGPSLIRGGRRRRRPEMVSKKFGVPARPTSLEVTGEETCNEDGDAEEDTDADVEDEQHMRNPAPLIMGRLTSIAIGMPVRFSSRKRMETEISVVSESEMNVDDVLEESCNVQLEEEEHQEDQS